MDLDRYQPTQFGRGRRTSGAHGYAAFFPAPIPREIEISQRSFLLALEAEVALAELNGVGRLLPNPHLLANPFLRREAVSSTRIEGTQASLTDLFEAEAANTAPNDDVQEVVNYVNAFHHGVERSRSLPLSIRLIREMHEIILSGARGHERHPGELRTSQNWIGTGGATLETAVFVPPPPTELGPLLDDFEQYLHDSPMIPPTVQAAIMHYQFETLHPFLDGNGRLGRLLIVFFLMQRGRLASPLLYLSPYLEARREQYYDALQGVRERGDLDSWLLLILEGIRVQSIDAATRAGELLALRERYRALFSSGNSSSAIAAIDLAFESPVLTAAVVERALSVSRPTALTTLTRLASEGVLTELAAGPRGTRRWNAPSIIRILVADEPRAEAARPTMP